MVLRTIREPRERRTASIRPLAPGGLLEVCSYPYSVTSRYLHLGRGDLWEAVDRLDEHRSIYGIVNRKSLKEESGTGVPAGLQTR